MAAKTALRVRHVPQRTCAGCGTVEAKRALVRVVRTPEGEVHPDATGKRAGRGSYLCHNPECWERAVKKGRLERSLRTKLSLEDAERLLAFARELAPAIGEQE